MRERFRRIAAGDDEILLWHVERFRGDLHHAGAEALSHVGAGKIHFKLAVRQLGEDTAAVIRTSLADADVFKSARHAYAERHIRIILFRIQLPVAGDDRLRLLLARADGLRNADALAHRFAGHRFVAGVERVAETNLEGIDPQPLCRLVDHRFNAVGALVDAEATERPALHSVRAHRTGVELCRVDAVRSEREDAALLEHAAAQARIRPGIGGDLRF